MTKFSDLSSRDRGFVVRALLNTRDVTDFKNVVANENIAFDEIENFAGMRRAYFKGLIIENYPYLLDGLYKSFKPNVTDEEIGDVIINKDNVNTKLGSNYGFNKDDMIEVGLSKLEKKRDLESKAIKSPEDYIDAVNDDLASIDKQAFIVYQQSFFKYHNEYKYESGRAKELAIGDMNVYKEILLKQHKAIYDKTEFDNASKRIISNPKAK